ncbi:MAG: hypothetical protein K9G41_07330 [Flavobacteriales bacterium]|nr:hypothetical protein [Flavobacteriales bacterium]
MPFILKRLFLGFLFCVTLASAHAQNIQTEVRYYGTGCFTIQRGENVLLTDPFIGNPSATKVLFGKIRTDTAYVKLYMNPAAFRKVKLVVAAHSHYDHLMDLPFVSRLIPDSTPIVCNKTGKHLLSFYKMKQPVVAANEAMGTETTIGAWHYSADSTMRTMAFESMHPPQTAGINFWNKRYAQDLVAEPSIVSDWQGGQTLSFIVDWLEDSVIAYRMFFLSSMAKAPYGLFPKELLDEHEIDDLFIGASGDSEYSSFPGPVVELCKPKRILLIHWENFFKSKEEPFKAIDTKGLEAMTKVLKEKCSSETQIITPIPLNYY